MRRRAAAGEELLDLAEHRRAVAGADEVVVAFELDEARTRHPLGDELRVARVDDEVAAAVEHERRDAEALEVAARVVRRDLGRVPGQGAGGERPALVARDPGAQLGVVHPRGGERRQARARPPHRGEVGPEPHAALLVEPEAEVVERRERRHGRVEHERLDALGTRRGEADRRGATRRGGEDDRALAAGGVEDGLEVADLVVERDRPVDAVAEPDAAPVQGDQPGEARQAREELPQPGILGQQLVRDGPQDQQQVELARAGRRPRDRDVAVPDVAGLELHVTRPCQTRRAGVHTRRWQPTPRLPGISGPPASPDPDVRGGRVRRPARVRAGRPCPGER